MRTKVAGVFFLALLCLSVPLDAQEGKVELKLVKYAGLKEAVLQQRGKVVLVDVWAEY